METYKQEFIEFILKAGALKFGDFTLKSGRQHCPYFLNIGSFYKGAQVAQLGRFYAAAVDQHIKDFDVVFGPPYKGIPLAVATTLALFQHFQKDVSYGFSRKEAKTHGDGGMLVGAPLAADSKVVIIDDVITAGTALRDALAVLKNVGDPHIQGVVIALDRMEKGQGENSAIQEAKMEFGIDVFAIVTLEEVVSYLFNRKIDGQIFIDDARLAQINAYREQYGTGKKPFNGTLQ